jgi:CarD family transcriptional regulator
MMFQIGDTVIHPGYGAGTVVDIGKLHCLGSGKPYYSIELADGSKTRVWVPVGDAGKRGVRHPTPVSQLGQIWHVLGAGPEAMSPDHDERNERLQEKLRGGEAFRVAEVVRDMFWEHHRSRRQTIVDKELYDRGLALLTSEVAVVQGCDLASAEDAISDVLAASVAAQPAV